MKPDKPVQSDKLDQELSELFDRTAEKPSGPTLTKLSARAADIPARVKRRPRWRSLLFWAPGTAAAIAALVLVLSPSFRHSRSQALAPSAPALSAPAPEKTAKAPAPKPAPTAAATTANSDATDLAAAFDDSDPTATADISLDPLYGPSQDDNLDAWLYATGAVLKNGG